MSILCHRSINQHTNY